MNQVVKKTYVGLYLSDNALSAVHLGQNEGRYQIERVETTPLYGGKIDWESTSSLETLKHAVQRILLKFQAPFEVIVLLGANAAIKRTLCIESDDEKEMVFQDIITDSHQENAPKYDGLLSVKNTHFMQTAILANAETISQWRRLISAAGFSLFGIDSMPLSVARMGRMFSSDVSDDYILLSVSDSLLDVSVIKSGEVSFSYSLVQDISALLRSDSGRVFLLRRWQEIVDTLGDDCPQKVVCIQSNSGLKPVYTTLSQNGASLEWTMLDWESQFDISKSTSGVILKNEDLTLFFWAITTALAVFDPISQPLLFHRRAEKDVPSFRSVKQQVFHSVWIKLISFGALFFFLALMMNVFIGHFETKTAQIVLEKEKIERSPVYQNLKQRAELAQTYVTQLSRLRDRQYSMVSLVNALVAALPEDMVFDAVNTTNSGEITLSLKSYSNTAIYTYFSFVESEWGRASLSEIKRVEDAYLNEMYLFDITFSLSREGMR